MESSITAGGGGGGDGGDSSSPLPAPTILPTVGDSLNSTPGPVASPSNGGGESQEVSGDLKLIVVIVHASGWFLINTYYWHAHAMLDGGGISSTIAHRWVANRTDV